MVAPKQFKSQPWILFDTVVASSFLLGDTSANGLAIGTQTPAVSANGEMVFFGGGGRTKSNYPWYTNMDLNGQLSYGMEVWQIYVYFAFPTLTPDQNNGTPAGNPGVAPTTKLAEAILNFGVLELNLGQEEQTAWPLTRFGGGGGLVQTNNVAQVGNLNGVPEGANVMKLAEAIEMPRTQNVNAKIRLAAEARPIIGTVAAPCVGSPLLPYSYTIGEEEAVDLTQLPFSVQVGFVGRRVKKTQYGQIPDSAPAG